MSINLKDKVGSGVSPEEFMQNMTQNKEAFEDWYEQFSWENISDKESFSSLQDRKDIHCFIVAAQWCGDVVRNVPVLFRLLEETKIPTEVLIIEENYEVIDQFLTNGGRSIPKAIFIDKNGEVLADWGPRPAEVQEVMNQFKATAPDREAPEYAEGIKQVYAEMGKRYGEGTGYHQSIAREIAELLQRV